MKKWFMLGIISVFVCLFSVCVNAQTFSDVQEDNWFYEDVMSAVEKGYINGYDDSTFKPNDTVSYGEFYKMLNEAIGEKVEIEKDAYHWAYNYAEHLRFKGDSSVITYSLDSKIKRQEVIRNVLYVFGIKYSVSPEYYDDVVFEDIPRRDLYCYGGYIQNAYQLGIVYGENNRIKPKENITRAEAVSIIERALKIEDWTVPKPTVLGDIEVVYDCEGAESYLEDICDALSRFPIYIIDNMVENGCEIIITNEKIDNTYTGIYTISENNITIYTHDNISNFFVSSVGTIIHEIGHYIHFNIMTDEDFEEIEDIFNDGKEPEELYHLIGHKYCKTDFYEFWAELVNYFYMYREDKHYERIPRSYEILEKYLCEKD